MQHQVNSVSALYEHSSYPEAMPFLICMSIYWNNFLIPFDPESDVGNITKWVKNRS